MLLFILLDFEKWTSVCALTDTCAFVWGKRSSDCLDQNGNIQKEKQRMAFMLPSAVVGIKDANSHRKTHIETHGDSVTEDNYYMLS